MGVCDLLGGGNGPVSRDLHLGTHLIVMVVQPDTGGTKQADNEHGNAGDLA